MTPIGVGIIGCGVISDAYIAGAHDSRIAEVRLVADLNREAAEAKAAKFGLRAVSVDELLASGEVDIVMNLTVPSAHGLVSRRIIEAGKHVYSEKPLATRFDEGRDIVALAEEAGVRIGCAPDTFLGGGHQAARALVDDGALGRITGGFANWMTPGAAHRYANPTFFLFKQGGGPVLDMGAYFITQMINMLGPVRRVCAMASNPVPSRPITEGPLAGSVIDIEVPTTSQGILEFEQGAVISLALSWDVPFHTRPPFELFGTGGTLIGPDPNFFGGPVRFRPSDGDWQEADLSGRPFAALTRTTRQDGQVADYRFAGVLDMAAAIADERPHRANGQMALHVLEALEGLGRSAEEGRHIELETTCSRPEPLGLGAGEDVFSRP